MHFTTLKMAWPANLVFALARMVIFLRSKLAVAVLLLSLIVVCPPRAGAAYVALYGSDGNDFVGFTGSSAIAGLKTSGWNGLLMWALTVQTNGDITYDNDTVTLAHNGAYVGPSGWGAKVASLKSPPTTVTRYEAALGGAGDVSFANIKSLIASQGTNTGSILYQNFQALKNAVPGLDAINDDDESTYDLGSSTSFGLMLNGLGYKFSLAPYNNQSFWVQLKNNLGSGCDLVYLQCYQGGAGNNPGSWDAAFGGGFHVTPGIESNSHNSATNDWLQWGGASQITSGFYWPDVAWAPGANWGAFEILSGINLSQQPVTPAGLQAAAGYGLVNLGWTGSASATNYNVKRSTSSGAETFLASTTNTTYADTEVTNGQKYYYVATAQSSLGPSGNSSEVAATPQPPAPGSYAAAVVADHPLAYWPLSETNGSLASDPVGGHNGTYVGGVTLAQPGVPSAGFVTPSYAALFNGTSGYVDVPEGPFNLTNAITVIAWINVPVAPSFSGIIGHGDSSWRASMNGSGEPGAADGSAADATSPTSIVGNSWHMVAYTYTGIPGVANNGSLYVNGVSVAHNTVSPTPAGSAYDVWIGGSPDYGTSRLLAGSIAQAAIFTNALSAAQVLALYNASLVAPPVTLEITPIGVGNFTLTWLEGTLLQSTNAAGPWTTNAAKSPYQLMTTNAQMFFKVQVN
jgi:hypothetical protein